jgi:DNA-binding transcriptional LysR family regulator
MDRFDALQLFVRIVECRSFTGAAIALDMPRATATNGINELEARLGIRLLERTTRQVRPTPDGHAFYERCLQVLADLEDAESSLQPAVSNPRGTLRLDMSGTHATRIVLPRIDEFRVKYPRVDLVISCGDRLVDLVREGVDCVIRAGTPRDSSLVARRLAVMPQVLCAAPEYLGRFGVPSQPDDLAGHQSVGFFSRTQGTTYPIELMIDGATKSFALNSPVSVDDAENYVVCALTGCGLIQLPRFHVEDELRVGSLVALLEDWPSPGLTVSALYSYHRQLSPRVRVFIDWVREIYEGRFGEIPGAA